LKSTLSWAMWAINMPLVSRKATVKNQIAFCAFRIYAIVALKFEVVALFETDIGDNVWTCAIARPNFPLPMAAQPVFAE
jgi:hypothetical protein